MPSLTMQDVAALAVAGLVAFFIIMAGCRSAVPASLKAIKFIGVICVIGFAIVVLNALLVVFTGKPLEVDQSHSGQNYAAQQQYYPNYQQNYQRYYAGPRN